MPEKGEALKIISQNERTRNFEVNEAELTRVLLRDDVRDMPVCVVAVAGAFRKGKSFLLNYFLRYCASQNKENWIGSPSDPLEGFSWVRSSQRQTTGILIWSEPFIVKLKSGEEIAILLMDTQGTFDTESSLKDSTVVFALTALVSSVVVYNLKGYIQEDDLMNLDAFTQYGLFARGGSDEATAFQKILFLIRDWIHPKEYAYGLQGGQRFLENILKDKPDQDPAHKDLRGNLTKCFSDIGCYLMPDPGNDAVKSEDFDGSHSKLDAKFVEHLKQLVPLLLAPENIEKETLAGQRITAEDLFNNFKIYTEAFNGEDLPGPAAVAENIAQERCKVAANKAKELYVSGMRKSGEEGSVLSNEDLDALHSSHYQSALKLYSSLSRLMNEKYSSSYERQLKEDLASLRQQFKEENTSKRSNQYYKRVTIVATCGAAAVGAVGAAVASPAIAAVAGAVAVVEALPVVAAVVSGSAAVAGATAFGIVKAVAAFATTSVNKGAAAVKLAVGRIDGAVVPSPATAAVEGASAVAGSAGRFDGAVAPSPASAAVEGTSEVARGAGKFIGAVAALLAHATVRVTAVAVDALSVIAAVRNPIVFLRSIVRYATTQNPDRIRKVGMRRKLHGAQKSPEDMSSQLRAPEQL